MTEPDEIDTMVRLLAQFVRHIQAQEELDRFPGPQLEATVAETRSFLAEFDPEDELGIQTREVNQ